MVDPSELLETPHTIHDMIMFLFNHRAYEFLSNIPLIVRTKKITDPGICYRTQRAEEPD